MMQGGIPIGMMPGMQGMQGMQIMPGMHGLQGMQGMPSIMMPQGMNLGMFGGGNPQIGMMAGNNGNSSNPNGQGAFIGMNQLQGINGSNGIPLNLLMTNSAQQQQNDKNKQT
jgi:hypothetical protein